MSKQNYKYWIDTMYLKTLHKYDPTLFTVKRMSSYACELHFDSAFALLLFLHQVTEKFLTTMMAWDSIEVRPLARGKFLVSLTVKPQATLNRLDFKFVRR